jgi:CRAL/TRIO domain
MPTRFKALLFHTATTCDMAVTLQALNEVMRRLQSCPYGLPSDSEAQWFLRDRSFDVEEATQKLLQCLKWRAEFGLQDITYEMIARADRTGKAYLHAHSDVKGRPALIIRVHRCSTPCCGRQSGHHEACALCPHLEAAMATLLTPCSSCRHVLGEFADQDSQRLCAFYIEKAIAARPPGVDQVIGIFDLKDFGPMNADFAFVRFLIEAFFIYYPKRAGEVLMVDAPWIFMQPYNMMQPLLGKYSRLIRFIEACELRSYFQPAAMPQDFVGRV